ncbi:hypothetical protein A2cp1_4009 [Anaeromyxobacter dehalogenans 2CP-1]|uniref:Uncharacterized protein n=2 Tax=Anaeromyxobacter dehalogenans TaxID=161493 RepID=B8J8P3_ANAD2|nr:hypothetical protein A2cp1_4009 [Anaeromyxobacter dehalogenans 2CP-1]
MLYLLLWSTLPFWLGGLIGYATSDVQEKSILITTVATFRNGELLVFTISTLAPTLYLMLHDPDGARIFPHKLPLSTIGVLTVVICGALFALLKANTIRDVPFVFALSVALSLLALLLRYVSMLYHRLRLPEVSERTLRAPETNFVREFQRHVGDGE